MNAEQQTKTCTKCGEIKPLDEFFKQKGRPFGRKSQCKRCVIDSQKERTKENPDRRALIKRNSNIKHRETLKKYRAKRIKELEKHYVLSVMRLRSSDVSPEILEMKRNLLMIERLIKKEMKDENRKSVE